MIARVGINDVGVEIEAGLAFGTGHHGTTRGCLLHLDRLLKRRRPRKVLDIGCGAGVLAIATAKALQRKVWLGDIDTIAVEVANANARLNGVAASAKAIVSRGDPTNGLLSPFELPRVDVAIGIGLIALVGFAAGLLPAAGAMRLRITDALRKV